MVLSRSLLNEEQKDAKQQHQPKVGQSGSKPNLTKAFAGSGPKVCHHCGKPGHIAANCWANPANTQQKGAGQGGSRTAHCFRLSQLAVCLQASTREVLREARQREQRSIQQLQQQQQTVQP